MIPAGLDGKRKAEDGGLVGNGLSLKVLRKHIKRLVNFAEAGNGEKIREELKRIVPEYHAESAEDSGK